MLKIEVNGGELDLPPGTVMELERESPLLQFNEQIKGGYSLPVTLKNNAINSSLMQYSGQLQKRIPRTGFDARLFDGQLFSMKGKLKIEKNNHNQNRGSKTEISVFLVTDVADFYQDIKDKKLRQINVGGARTFSGVGSPWYNSAFGVHVENVAKGMGGTYDYAFFPVMNTSWGDDPGADIADADVMNKVFQTESGMRIGPLLVPFPYLKYVLLQAVDYAGWSITGDILDDADFATIVMINFKAIDWAKYRNTGGSTYELDHYSSISFNLQDHLPDISIAEFLIALKNRFGWWYDFDFRTKTITISQISTVLAQTPKDFTAISSPIIPKTVFQDGKIFSLKNNFVVNSNTGIDLSKVDYQGAVDDLAALPTAASGVNGHVYLVEEENNYYICNQNESNPSVWQWDILAANIYDYVPDGATEEIVTMATTLEMVKYSDYMDFIPRIDAPGSWTGINGENSWGIHLAFNVGFGDRKLGASGGFSYKYPQAITHCYSTLGTQVKQWSLAFKGQLNNGTQVGLYDLQWKAFLDRFNDTEEVTITCYPSLKDYMVLKLTDIIVVCGVKLLIKTIKQTIPYRGKIDLVCWRI